MEAPIIIPRPDPLTLLIPVWLVFWGAIGAVLFVVQPPATTESLPPFGVFSFFGGLVVTGSALLFGMWLRSINGVRIKVGANVALGSLCLIYSGWSLQALGLVRPLVFVSLLLTISGASFWQARRLNAVLSRLEN